MYSTESQIKSFASINVKFDVTASKCDGGYTITISTNELNLTPVTLITTHSKTIRVFKSLDAIVSTCERIGLGNFSVSFA